jgi:hypothetical protein
MESESGSGFEPFCRILYNEQVKNRPQVDLNTMLYPTAESENADKFLLPDLINRLHSIHYKSPIFFRHFLRYYIEANAQNS